MHACRNGIFAYRRMPKANNRVLCKGIVLAELLRKTKVKVKVKDAAYDDLGTVHPVVALAMISYGEYEGKASPTRVYFIREIFTRADPLDDAHFWDDRAVIRYATDQTACVPSKIKSRRAAMLLRDPRPLSWRSRVTA